jgi:hypothetical protein
MPAETVFLCTALPFANIASSSRQPHVELVAGCLDVAQQRLGDWLLTEAAEDARQLNKPKSRPKASS